MLQSSKIIQGSQNSFQTLWKLDYYGGITTGKLITTGQSITTSKLITTGQSITTGQLITTGQSITTGKLITTGKSMYDHLLLCKWGCAHVEESRNCLCRYTAFQQFMMWSTHTHTNMQYVRQRDSMTMHTAIHVWCAWINMLDWPHRHVETDRLVVKPCILLIHVCKWSALII
jgi:hypothetical protein